MNLIKHARQIFISVLFAIGISYVIYILLDGWNCVLLYLKSMDVPLFILSLIIAVANYLYLSVVYDGLLRKYGFTGKYQLVRNIFFFGQFAKYIPGKVWGAAYHLASIKMPSAGMVVTMANIDFFAVSCLVILGTSLGLILGKFSLAGGLFVFTVFSLVSAALIYSRGIFLLAQRVIGLISRQRSFCQCHGQVTFFRANQQVVMIAFLYLLSNFLFMSSVFGLPLDVAVNYIAYLGVGWVLGVILIVVPAGVGVREMTFIYLAKLWVPDVSTTMLGAMAVLLRLWQVVQDIVGGVFVMFLIWREKRIRQQSSVRGGMPGSGKS